MFSTKWSPELFLKNDHLLDQDQDPGLWEPARKSCLVNTEVIKIFGMKEMVAYGELLRFPFLKLDGILVCFINSSSIAVLICFTQHE